MNQGELLVIVIAFPVCGSSRMFETEAARERWVARAAVAALMISIVSAVFTGLQWWAASRAVEVADQARKDANAVAATQRLDSQATLEQQRKDASDSLRVQISRADKANVLSDRSAKAAEASAAVAFQALHVSERAYIEITGSLERPPLAGEKLLFLASLNNSGRTPATELVSHVTGIATLSTESIDDAYAKMLKMRLSNGQQGSVGILPPGATAENRTESLDPLTQLQVDYITEGKALVRIFATASYKDIFGESHNAEFCAFYQFASKKFSPCQKYNKLD